MIMMVHFCPSGSEGASNAMFTTVNNAASILVSATSTMVLQKGMYPKRLCYRVTYLGW